MQMFFWLIVALCNWSKNLLIHPIQSLFNKAVLKILFQMIGF